MIRYETEDIAFIINLLVESQATIGRLKNINLLLRRELIINLGKAIIRLKKHESK